MRRPKARPSRRSSVPTHASVQRDAERPSRDAATPSTSTQPPVRRVRSRMRPPPPPSETQVPHSAISLRTSTVSQPPISTTLSVASRRQRRNSFDSRSTSSLWSSLPLNCRIISILAGFIFVYYIVFGKHHHYDREISSIHSDVEKLMSHINRSGIFQQNVVEAELPEIFREESDSKTSPSPTPSPPAPKDKKKSSKKDKASKKSKEKEKAAAAKSEPEPPGDPAETTEKKAPPVAPPKVDAQTPSDSNQQTSLESPAATPKDASSSTPSTKSQSTETNSTANAPASVPDDASKPSPPTSGDSDRPGDDASSKSNGQETTPSAAQSKEASQNTTSSDAVAQGTTAQPPSTTETKENTETSGSTSTAAGSVPDAAVADVSGDVNRPSTGSAIGESDTHNYEKEFKDLEGEDVPEGHVPVLTWNYKSVLDPEVKEQIFGLGDRLDHVAMYKPLCLDSNTGSAFSFRGEPICSGFNRTYGWLVQYCSVMKEAMRKEYLLEVRKDGEEARWLEENSASIQWVEGLTVLQVLEKNCGNIAHYSGRILLLEHIINNMQAYAAPPSNIENILILPTFHIMKRFIYPHNYEFWHKTMLHALLTPGSYEIGTLGDFLTRNEKARTAKQPVVQLLHNFSVNTETQKPYVCFRRALIPGYLKARFFINDEEYPSTYPSLQSKSEAAPKVPRDSLRMREKVSALLNQSPQIPKRRKEIVLLDRGGSRRVFGPEAREQVISMLTRVATENGYSFNITSFDKMEFRNQYDIMKTVSIAVGIHGANLVNTMFMPPLSVLIELFPFGFKHDMYSNGGNAGLKYFSYQMNTGEQFKGPKVYRTVEQCIRFSQECKMHYRDAALQVDAVDLAAMETVLREGIAWCDSLGGA